MSKSIAILVLDYTPDYCEECPCFKIEDSIIAYCGVTREVLDFDKEYKWVKPDWCPLQEAPEYEPVWYDDQRSDYELGWNACLDDILGVKDDI